GGYHVLPYLAAGAGSRSTDTSENRTVLVASREWELTPSPINIGLPNWFRVCPSSLRSTVFGDPHRDGSALPDQLQLPDPRTFDRKIDGVGIVGLGVAELNRRRAVTVD